MREYSREDYNIFDTYIDAYGDNSWYLIRQIIRYNADDQIRTTMREFMDTFSSENDLDSYSFKRFIKDSLWNELSRRLNPKDIEYLSQFIIKK